MAQSAMTTGKKLRILVCKAGLDGHDRGAKIVARALRDAGFEVIYTGLHNTPETIVQTAIEEDVDAIGVSILSGAHNYVIPEIIRQLKANGADDIPVFGGGIIPEEDARSLIKKGVKKIFGPGTPMKDIVDWVRENIEPRGLL